MKPESISPKTRYNVEALSRGLEILSLFSDERPALSFSQIIGLLDLNKSTVYRMLATLESMHFLEPGIGVLKLGFTAINSMEVSQVAHNHLEKLSIQLGETVSLAVLDGFRTIYVDRIRNQAIVGVVLKIGSSLPAHCSSLGKVLLADLSAAELEALLAEHPLTAYTPQTLTTPEALYKELDEIRQRGYAFGNDELAVGLRAVSAPVRDSSRRAVAAVNVTGLSVNMTQERIVNEVIPALVETVRQISISLGYSTI
ncbi:MAG: IclR family transcriptional regulator [Chloroflexi bacterium]|nr:IclR family transcriptional regulator [Chloroflexota bacterium]